MDACFSAASHCQAMDTGQPRRSMTPIVGNRTKAGFEPPNLPSRLPSHRESDFNSPTRLECDNFDSLWEVMRDLMALHVRFHRLQTRVESTIPTAQLWDDLTGATQSLLDFTGRFSASSSDNESMVRCYTKSVSCSDKAFLKWEIPPPGRFHSIESVSSASSSSPSSWIGTDESPPSESCPLPDTSTFFMILSCFQKLLDLFHSICQSISTCVEEAGTIQRPSMAQLVMSTELLSHLAARLDRGLERIFGHKSPSSTMSHSVSACPTAHHSLPKDASHVKCSITDRGYSSDGYPHNSMRFWGETQDLPVAAGQEDLRHSSGSWMQKALVVVVDVMGQREAALRATIQDIRNFINRSNLA